MQNSRIIHLVALTTFVLCCLACRGPLGEQQGTTPPENAVPSSKKDDVKKPQPEKVVPQLDKSIPTKSKNGQKPTARDTLAPKIALS
ncbi:hypothetical protein [Arenibacter sp. F20364]|uniref:hypothetical protein n=1 Tax=Arenibacter sp. F20364 TaxID=2926415 RepID=UPI001FF17541|nr:hypothetical protein [Arenibacter sp. F20364]MCK0190628.1 hypothetical protein [Arenibacter sp. F20364]